MNNTDTLSSRIEDDILGVPLEYEPKKVIREILRSHAPEIDLLEGLLRAGGEILFNGIYYSWDEENETFMADNVKIGGVEFFPTLQFFTQHLIAILNTNTKEG